LPVYQYYRNLQTLYNNTLCPEKSNPLTSYNTRYTEGMKADVHETF